MRGEGQRVFKRIAGASADQGGATPDGVRTRDLCRDSEKEGRNLQKTSVTDGFFWRCKARSGTIIEPKSPSHRLSGFHDSAEYRLYAATRARVRGEMPVSM